MYHWKILDCMLKTMLIILGWIVNTTGGIYMIIQDILHFEYERHSYELQKLWGKWLQPQFRFAHHTSHMFNILGEVGWSKKY
jgi:hypothetical protein